MLGLFGQTDRAAGAGLTYYYNSETKVSVWTKPGEEMASDIADGEQEQVDQIGDCALGFHVQWVIWWRDVGAFFLHGSLMPCGLLLKLLPESGW